MGFLTDLVGFGLDIFEGNQDQLMRDLNNAENRWAAEENAQKIADEIRYQNELNRNQFPTLFIGH